MSVVIELVVVASFVVVGGVVDVPKIKVDFGCDWPKSNKVVGPAATKRPRRSGGCVTVVN
jgi:hypothetical protein